MSARSLLSARREMLEYLESFSDIPTAPTVDMCHRHPRRVRHARLTRANVLYNDALSALELLQGSLKSASDRSLSPPASPPPSPPRSLPEAPIEPPRSGLYIPPRDVVFSPSEAPEPHPSALPMGTPSLSARIDEINGQMTSLVRLVLAQQESLPYHALVVHNLGGPLARAFSAPLKPEAYKNAMARVCLRIRAKQQRSASLHKTKQTIARQQSRRFGPSFWLLTLLFVLRYCALFIQCLSQTSTLPVAASIPNAIVVAGFRSLGVQANNLVRPNSLTLEVLTPFGSTTLSYSQLNANLRQYVPNHVVSNVFGEVDSPKVRHSITIPSGVGKIGIVARGTEADVARVRDHLSQLVPSIPMGSFNLTRSIDRIEQLGRLVDNRVSNLVEDFDEMHKHFNTLIDERIDRLLTLLETIHRYFAPRDEEEIPTGWCRVSTKAFDFVPEWIRTKLPFDLQRPVLVPCEMAEL